MVFNSQTQRRGCVCRPLSKADVQEEAESYKGWVRMTSVSVGGLTVFLLYLASAALYIAARCAFSLRGLGDLMGYGVFVLVVEILSILSLIFYGIWLCARTSQADVRGKGGDDDLGLRRLYTVRVFILCRHESLALVRRTVASVKNAYPAEGCERKLYLLDESKDNAKRDFFMSSKAGADVIYIAPPVRPNNVKVRTCSRAGFSRRLNSVRVDSAMAVDPAAHDFLACLAGLQCTSATEKPFESCCVSTRNCSCRCATGGARS